MKHALALMLFIAAPAGGLAMDFDSLGFLAGCWESRQNTGETSEECWLEPRANLMVGMGRNVKGMFAEWEFMRIENRKEGIVLVAQPRAGQTTEFRAVKVSRGEAVFENLQHDFPQRLRYWRDGELLRCRIEDAAGKKGMDLSWARHKGQP